MATSPAVDLERVLDIVGPVVIGLVGDDLCDVIATEAALITKPNGLPSLSGLWSYLARTPFETSNPEPRGSSPGWHVNGAC